jgi:hypothetical protein
VGNATDSVISGLAQDFAEMSTQVMEALTGFWLDLPTPTVDADVGVASWLADATWLFVAAAAVTGVLVAAIKTALSGDKRPVGEMIRGLALVMLVTSGAAFVVAQLVYIGDEWASWVYEGTVGNEPINLGIGLASAVSPGLVLVMALAAGITGVVQIGLMLARAALIPVLVGLLPVAAAASMTGTGRQWFGKLVAWLAAFILYKPVAALLYAAAFRLSDGSDGILGMVSGVAMLILAVLALPALMRVIVPATAALGSANAASIGAAGVGAIATGAITVVAAGAALASGGATAGGAAAAKGASKAGHGAATAGKGTGGGGPSGAGPAPSGPGSGGPKPSGSAPPPSGAGGTTGGGTTTGTPGANGTSGVNGTSGTSSGTGAGGSKPVPASTAGSRSGAGGASPKTGAPGGGTGSGTGSGSTGSGPSGAQTTSPAPSSGTGAPASSPAGVRRPPLPRPAPQRIPEATGSWVTDGGAGGGTDDSTSDGEK